MPTTQVAAYVVQPTGYTTFVNSDKDLWRIFVVDSSTELGWSVRRGSSSSFVVMNHKGEWVYDNSRYRRHRRFPLEKALALAEQHVDTHKLNWSTAQEASDRVAARLTSRETDTNPGEVAAS